MTPKERDTLIADRVMQTTTERAAAHADAFWIVEELRGIELGLHKIKGPKANMGFDGDRMRQARYWHGK